MTDSIRTFLVPDLGEGLEEVTIVEWDVSAGDTVDLNHQLCTVETAKAEVEIPSPYAGQVVERFGDPGDTLEVGTPLIRIDVAPAQSPAASSVDEATAAATGSGNSSPSPDGSTELPTHSTPSEVGGEVAPSAEGEKAEHNSRTPLLVGYGVDTDIDVSRRSKRSPTTARPRAKPAARQLARDHGIDLTQLTTGSGIDGAITRTDVETAINGSVPAPRVADEPAAVIEVRGVRARIADRMTLSRSTIPDAHATVEVDCSQLLELRSALAEGSNGIKLSPFTLILRLLVGSLQRHPLLNARWSDVDGQVAILTQPSINLGFGAATPRGLIVPVVAHAERLSTAELAVEVQRLVLGAREGSLRPTELTGSTFTVSNFGALGLDDGVPVINYPEAAILGLGAIRDRVVADQGTAVVRPMMTMTCAFDHRIADGADVAAFLVDLKTHIERPELALLHL